MSERDDYLWDGSGPPDPEIARLEALLRPFEHQGRPLLETPPQSPRTTTKRGWPLLAIGIAAAAGLVLWALFGGHDRAGTPLAPGAPERTFVAEAEPLPVGLGAIAKLMLAPGSSLRFSHWRGDEVLFQLERGRVRAEVAPPPAVQPGFFRIGTKAGLVIDQGCAFELAIDTSGVATVLVTEGAVTFEQDGRSVFVPAGATTSASEFGLGTPCFLLASADLREAVAYFDNARSKSAAALRRKGLEAIAAACRERRDSLVCWHLLRDDDPVVRATAAKVLLDLCGPPEPVGKENTSEWTPEQWLPFLRISAWQPEK